MNEGINNDMQKVSLASVFESAKADKQRETNDNKLEEAMNEVDDKRTEIGNL